MNSCYFVEKLNNTNTWNIQWIKEIEEDLTLLELITNTIKKMPKYKNVMKDKRGQLSIKTR